MPRASTGIWKMRDGTKTHVRDMDISHIENARRMMQRKLERVKQRELDYPEDWKDLGKEGDWTQEWIARFEEELTKRGVPFDTPLEVDFSTRRSDEQMWLYSQLYDEYQRRLRLALVRELEERYFGRYYIDF